MVPTCNETSNKKNNVFKVMLDLMDIKPERKKKVIHAMFYYMPSQLLLVETELIVPLIFEKLRYQRRLPK